MSPCPRPELAICAAPAPRTEGAIDDPCSFALRLEALARMSAALTGVSDEAQLYDVASQYVSDLIPVERASLALINGDGRTLRIRSLHGAQGAADNGAVIESTGRAIGQVCRDGRSLYVPDLRALPLTDLDILYRQGYRSAMMVPLTASDTVIGSINLARTEPDGFSPDDLRLLDHAGRFLAMAITSVRRLEATANAERASSFARELAAQRVREIECLNRVFRILSEEWPIEQRLNLTARELTGLRGVDHCELALIDNDGVLRTVGQAGQPPLGRSGAHRDGAPQRRSGADQDGRAQGRASADQDEPPPAGGTARSQPAERRRPVWSRDHADDDGWSPHQLAVPITVRGRPAGNLALFSIGPRTFGASQGVLAETVAAKIANALERDLMVAELRQAAEDAEAVSQARARFLATMSHELRTPMNGVIGMTRLLEDTELTSQQRMYVETIRTSGEAQVAVINHILDFSKAEAGRLELQARPFDLRTCIEDALDLAAATLGAKPVDLSCEIDPHLPVAYVGDANRIRQILINLVGNAVKFTDEGEIVVTVDDLGEELPDPGEDTDGGTTGQGQADAPAPAPVRRRLRISVHDSGPGIPADRIGWLFEPFTQLGDHPGGSGLGLAICKQLTTLMGGSIAVDSTEGEGSTFRVDLTLPPHSEPLGHGDLRQRQPALHDRAALLVGPPVASVDAVERALRRWGLSVQRVETAPPWLAGDAPANRRAGDGAVAATDLDLVVVDGRSLAAANPGNAGVGANSPVPVIVVEAASDRLSPPAARGAGRVVTVKRPARLSDLAGALTRALTDAERGEPIAPGAHDKVSGVAPGSRPVLDADLGRRHPLRILVAEDNVVNQKVVVALLERLGYHPDLVGDGRQAIDATVAAAGTGSGYDLVLMDLKMPVVNGIEATSEILRCVVDRPPRIVALTADTISMVGEACLAAGMGGFLVKPLDVDALIEVVTTTTGHPSAATPSPLGTTGSPSGAQRPDEIDVSSEIDEQALATLLEVVGNRPQLVADIVRAFCADAPPLVEAIALAAIGDDAEGAAAAAHPLKSASATVGAHRLAAEAATVEQGARSGRVPGPEELAALQESARRALSGLRSRFDQLHV